MLEDGRLFLRQRIVSVDAVSGSCPIGGSECRRKSANVEGAYNGGLVVVERCLSRLGTDGRASGLAAMGCASGATRRGIIMS